MHRDRNPGVDTPRLGKHRAIKSIQAQHVSYSVLKDFRPLSEESRYCITFSRLRSNPIQDRGHKRPDTFIQKAMHTFWR